eukprot:TRINITY_DN6363_c0_g1_i1.p1 TRINITY_DN6363_c0_g1~~TRINITY_DN6363_c0_g1_i1.p1  ORF type:complete len:497 (-),score=122.15 TRINITY_DN6363_c0_g1_i1:117-1574(-)
MSPGKRSVAERIASALQPQETLDPADADALGDETAAGQRRASATGSFAGAADLDAEKGRLRLRPKVPVLEAYKGKKVARREVFGASDDDDSDDAGMEPPPELSAEDDEADDGSMDEDGDTDITAAHASSGGFSIAGNLEQEYDKMMQKSQKDLEVMRQPSTEDVARRENQAKSLKSQLEMWAALVEFRIHLEPALGIGHRLPVSGSGLRAEPAVAKEAELACSESRKLLGSLLALQQKLGARHGLRPPPTDAVASSSSDEAAAWSSVDGRLQTVLDQALDVADDWKEKTRLDARRQFKVLDQSLRLQMQVVADTDKDKLRKRCTPPPGKHKVFGAAPAASQQEGHSSSNSAHRAVEHPADEDDQGAAEIFDDRDFYVQLLREVLSSSSGGALGGGDDEKALRAEFQGRRASKRKAREQVERRASKGRKIRYKAIEKLQNFMSARPRGSFRPGSSELGLDEVEPLQESACEALLSSLFAQPKVSLV